MCLYPASKVDSHVFVLGVSILLLSTILIVELFRQCGIIFFSSFIFYLILFQKGNALDKIR
jgi:hypothetical protein